MQYSSVLYINFCASSLPFPPKYFPKVYEQHTYNFSLTRTFLIYAVNKWSCRSASNGQLYLGSWQLSAEGEEKRRKNKQTWGWCEEQQEEIREKKSFKIFSSVVEERT